MDKNVDLGILEVFLSVSLVDMLNHDLNMSTGALELL